MLKYIIFIKLINNIVIIIVRMFNAFFNNKYNAKSLYIFGDKVLQINFGSMNYLYN